VSEDELVQVDLKLRLAHPVVGANQPLMEISNSAPGQNVMDLVDNEHPQLNAPQRMKGTTNSS